MESTVFLRFDDTDAAIAFENCADLFPVLKTIASGWNFEYVPDTSDTFLTISLHDQLYTLNSPFIDTPKSYKDPVDTVCALIVELAWAHLRANPEFLCLHGAAIEFAGQLVVIPSTKKSGKSTLTACLAEQGACIFTDDFLPIRINQDRQITGLASGINPRLRLPPPIAFTKRMRDFVDAGHPVANKRYSYLNLPDKILAPRGAERPISTILLLDRQDEAAAEIKPVDRATALKALILQNFSRALNSANILQLMYFLAMQARVVSLRYSDAEKAARLLCEQFSNDAQSVPVVNQALLNGFLADQPDLNRPHQKVHFDPTARFTQNGAVKQITIEDRHFLADEAGFGIFEMNEISGAVWSALAIPSSSDDVTDLFKAAFPEVEAEKIETDVMRTLRRMAAVGLIQTDMKKRNDKVRAKR